AGIAIIPLDAAAIRSAIDTQLQDVAFLIDKYQRFGFIDEAQATRLLEGVNAESIDGREAWNSAIIPHLPDEYASEWHRAMRLLAHLITVHHETSGNQPIRVDHPPTLVRGAVATFGIQSAEADESTIHLYM